MEDQKRLLRLLQHFGGMTTDKELPQPGMTVGPHHYQIDSIFLVVTNKRVPD